MYLKNIIAIKKNHVPVKWVNIIIDWCFAHYIHVTMHVDQNNISYTAIDPISQLIPDQIKYMYWGGIELFPCHTYNQ